MKKLAYTSLAALTLAVAGPVFATEQGTTATPETTVSTTVATETTAVVTSKGEPLTQEAKPGVLPVDETADKAKGETLTQDDKPALTPVGDSADKAKGVSLTQDEKPKADEEALKQEVAQQKAAHNTVQAADTPIGSKSLPKTSAAK